MKNDDTLATPKKAFGTLVDFFEENLEALEPKKNVFAIHWIVGDMVALENVATHHQLIIQNGLDLWSVDKSEPQYHKPNASLTEALAWLNPRIQ